jgi:curved DNA-binding protein CbpA
VDHYRVLQVSHDAEPEVIDRAYRTLSMKYHPDVVPEGQRESAHRRMQRINLAYAVLSEPTRRRDYDRTLAQQPGHSAWDVFMSKGLVGMFLDKVAPRQASRPRR